MRDEYALAIAGYVIIGVLSPLVFFYLALYNPTASRWIRCVLAILGVIGIPYSTFGVLRLASIPILAGRCGTSLITTAVFLAGLQSGFSSACF
jgi:hypothetical protein